MENHLSRPGDFGRYPAREIDFADSIQPNPDAIESRIATVLWNWKFADSAKRDAIISDSKLATLLEYWFPFSDIECTRRLGTWCDGIPLLHVHQIDRITFSISGVGYFPYQWAPFETEWKFQSRRDLVPQSVVLRLGTVTHENQQTTRHNKCPERIFSSRPTDNSDWMIAVELTELRT
jgi:hypothetical protein